MPDIKVLAILYIGLALIVGIFSSKLMKLIHFPNVTGYLLSGILIGPWLLGLINQEIFNDILKEVSWMSEVALGFIAFTIGGSFKLSALKRVG
ncbi:MAG: cation:proton antiporter, partial [Bacilli bacterium]|nr:cation:proton antiporter [Bacilli bacterium]